MEVGLLGGKSRMKVREGRGLELRLLSAFEVMQARREAEELARGGDREKALCSNACLLARALERDGKPVFSSGEQALEKLRVEEITALAEQWADLNRTENRSVFDGEEQVEAAKKGWSTRLRSALCGACSGLFRRSRRSGGPER